MDAQRLLAVPNIERTDRADGSIVLRNRDALPDPLPDILDRFDFWVAEDGGATMVSDDDGANIASRRALDRRSDAAAARLNDLVPRAASTIAAIAGASVEHAVLKLACHKAGLVHAALSPALIGSEFGRNRLAGLLAIAKPALILADGPSNEIANALAPITNAPLHDMGALTAGNGAASFVRPQHAPGDAAALYFTSGSTGVPKGVTITRGMIASNQAAYCVHWPFLTCRPPVLLDWLPWHHVFGGLDNFYKMIWNGGEYHVDLPPDPTRVDAMAARLRAVRPTLHINVPFGIALLLDRLDTDAETRDAFFSRLELIMFAGAGMDSATWARLRRAVAAVPNPPTLVSGYGMTEAASTICLGLEAARETGEIGFPLPGHALRLKPIEDAEASWEIRVRGPNVAPHYVTDKGIAPLPLDSAGFLKTGDLAAAIHDTAPERGIAFDGRLAEDFKLATGTRVKTGALRHALLEACAPDLADVAIAGEGRNHLAAILFPRRESPAPDERAALTSRLEQALTRHNARFAGSSTAIRRAILAPDPPDRDAGEINDKGHLVQRRALANREPLVARLYADMPHDRIIVSQEEPL
ncbi:MAG: AMP-binding protein [Alphaproteobacteria bacterium]|nr:AMP-binding protein [Alphaproteobacteria bacterium]